MVDMCYNWVFPRRKNMGKVFYIFNYDKFLLLGIFGCPFVLVYVMDVIMLGLG